MHLHSGIWNLSTTPSFILVSPYPIHHTMFLINLSSFYQADSNQSLALPDRNPPICTVGASSVTLCDRYNALCLRWNMFWFWSMTVLNLVTFCSMSVAVYVWVINSKCVTQRTAFGFRASTDPALDLKPRLDQDVLCHPNWKVILVWNPSNSFRDDRNNPAV